VTKFFDWISAGAEISPGNHPPESPPWSRTKRKNDLDIVREVLKVTKGMPMDRSYVFSSAKKGQRADASGLETLETFSSRLRNLMIDDGTGVTRAISHEVKRLDSDISKNFFYRH
jgi:hypothetical protein